MVAFSLAADEKQGLFNHSQFIEPSFGLGAFNWLQF